MSRSNKINYLFKKKMLFIYKKKLKIKIQIVLVKKIMRYLADKVVFIMLKIHEIIQ